MPSDARWIRMAGEDDLSAMAALETLCFSAPWSETALRDTLNSPYAALFCAEHDGTVIAYGGVYLLGDDADVTNIAVHPDHRRQGAGGAVLGALIAHARAGGAQALHLEVRESNEGAIALYTKTGFAVDGIRKNYYKNPTENAILMTLSLS